MAQSLPTQDLLVGISQEGVRHSSSVVGLTQERMIEDFSIIHMQADIHVLTCDDQRTVSRQGTFEASLRELSLFRIIDQRAWLSLLYGVSLLI